MVREMKFLVQIDLGAHKVRVTTGNGQTLIMDGKTKIGSTNVGQDEVDLVNISASE